MRDFEKVKLCVSNGLFDTLWDSSKEISNLFRASNKIAHRKDYVIVVWNAICWEDSNAVKLILDVFDKLDDEAMSQDLLDYLDKEKVPTWVYQINGQEPVVSRNSAFVMEMFEILEEF